jgi:hypothetical protein
MMRERSILLNLSMLGNSWQDLHPRGVEFKGFHHRLTVKLWRLLDSDGQPRFRHIFDDRELRTVPTLSSSSGFSTHGDATCSNLAWWKIVTGNCNIKGFFNDAHRFGDASVTTSQVEFGDRSQHGGAHHLQPCVEISLAIHSCSP